MHSASYNIVRIRVTRSRHMWPVSLTTLIPPPRPLKSCYAFVTVYVAKKQTFSPWFHVANVSYSKSQKGLNSKLNCADTQLHRRAPLLMQTHLTGSLASVQPEKIYTDERMEAIVSPHAGGGAPAIPSRTGAREPNQPAHAVWFLSTETEVRKLSSRNGNETGFILAFVAFPLQL